MIPFEVPRPITRKEIEQVFVDSEPEGTYQIFILVKKMSSSEAAACTDRKFIDPIKGPVTLTYYNTFDGQSGLGYHVLVPGERTKEGEEEVANKLLLRYSQYGGEVISTAGGMYVVLSEKK